MWRVECGYKELIGPVELFNYKLNSGSSVLLSSTIRSKKLIRSKKRRFKKMRSEEECVVRKKISTSSDAS